MSSTSQQYLLPSAATHHLHPAAAAAAGYYQGPLSSAGSGLLAAAALTDPVLSRAPDIASQSNTTTVSHVLTLYGTAAVLRRFTVRRYSARAVYAVSRFCMKQRRAVHRR